MQFLRLGTRVLAFAIAGMCLSLSGATQSEEPSHGGSDRKNTTIEEVVVVSDPGSLVQRSVLGSASSVDAETISLVGASHPSEILSRFPGVWVVRGSGQEHLMGIRSAVLAGAGACGAFLFLEDNVPVRPVGFCNVNGLFELNIEQADAIEVLRGPASPLFGGNALHGVINVRSFLNESSPSKLGLEGGPYDYIKLFGDYRHEGYRFKILSTSTSGFRDSTGYNQQKLNISSQYGYGNWDVTHSAAVTMLNQETGGYVRGFKAYEHPDLRRSNPNPEAFRDAKSIRVTSHWTSPTNRGELYLGPYVRRSMMKFLQHFLPGQPFEKNSQSSAGSVVHWSQTFSSYNLTVGAQFEGMQAQLLQVQENEAQGSPFLVATRPKGIHYNYEVASLTGALFNSLAYSPNARSELNQSLRIEIVNYDYNNLHSVGNNRDDDSRCGFGGCLYSRPADRSDRFANVAARFGFKRVLNKDTFFWGLVGWGYRPPQTTELYRLQRGQAVAELDSEKLRSMEMGVDIQNNHIDMSLSAYMETKRDLIFRDSEGLNVSDGKTFSEGLELELSWTPNETNQFALTASVAAHTYAFTRDVARGERIVDGAEVDSAPALLANARWRFRPTQSTLLEVEVIRVGSHHVDAANSASYEGHTLANARLSWSFSTRWRTSLRIVNLLDDTYADRADFAFGNYRYFPGHPRQIFVAIAYSIPNRESWGSQ